MKASSAPPVIPAGLEERDHVGEAPHWDEHAGDLVWVDITEGAVHRWRPGASSRVSFAAGGDVSAAIPRVGGGFLLAVDHELVLRDRDGTHRVIASVEEDMDDNRFNDCRCDAAGRLWAGTMSRSRRPGTGALYRLEAGGAPERVLEGTTISNGLGWSPTGEQMYFVDSTTQRIDVLDHDPVTGEIANRRQFAAIAAADGLPDGLAVDVEGGVWVCLFGGRQVRRFDADGKLDAVVPLPVTNPTCPAFGGDDLSSLFVTTARHRLTPTQLAREPLAGALLVVEPGIRGLPRHRFGG